MPKRPDNKWKSRTKDDGEILRKLTQQNTPTVLIALKLWRTESSIYAKAQELWISLHPTNKSPYWTK